MPISHVSAEAFLTKFGPLPSGKVPTPKRETDAKVKWPARADVKDAKWWGRLWQEPLAKWWYKPRQVKVFHTVQYRPVMDELREVTKQQRMVFVKEITKGKTPSQSAKKAGVKLKVLMADELVNREVDKIIREHSLPAERRRLLQRALVNKAALELSQAQEVDYKSLGVFLKLLGEDPEVGIAAKGGVIGITTNVSMSPQVEALHREALVELQEMKSLPYKMGETGEAPKLLPSAFRPQKGEDITDVGEE